MLARERDRADGMLDPGVVHSWIDMVNASQDNQPHWMTPIITTTPRLEPELRWDFYDQQNGSPPQGNGQRFLNDGGPGGPRVEFIPTYNSQITLGAPPTVSAVAAERHPNLPRRLACLPEMRSVWFYRYDAKSRRVVWFVEDIEPEEA